MIERVEAGWVDVPNPMFRNAADQLKRLSHVSLRPEHVLAIVWWSKNYAVYERFARAFARYRVQYFHFTVNSRRPDLAWLEPDMPPIEEVLRQMRFLVGLPGGPQMVAWRYDPICFWTEGRQVHSSWDPAFFDRMCHELSAIGVRRCFTSLVDRYTKFEQRVRRLYPRIRLRDPSPDEVSAIGSEMATMAHASGIQILACTEARLATQDGIAKGACIDGHLLRTTIAPATDRKMRGREECGCTLHTDIGDYVSQECGYACIYCYANPNHRGFERSQGSRAARSTPIDSRPL